MHLSKGFGFLGTSKLSHELTLVPCLNSEHHDADDDSTKLQQLDWLHHSSRLHHDHDRLFFDCYFSYVYSLEHYKK